MKASTFAVAAAAGVTEPHLLDYFSGKLEVFDEAVLRPLADDVGNALSDRNLTHVHHAEDVPSLIAVFRSVLSGTREDLVAAIEAHTYSSELEKSVPRLIDRLAGSGNGFELVRRRPQARGQFDESGPPNYGRWARDCMGLVVAMVVVKTDKIGIGDDLTFACTMGSVEDHRLTESGERDELLVSVRQEFLDGAAKEFAENGYANASVRRMAARNGIAESELSRCFESKAEIFIEAICKPLERDLKRFLAQWDRREPYTEKLGHGHLSVLLSVHSFLLERRGELLSLLVVGEEELSPHDLGRSGRSPLGRFERLLVALAPLISASLSPQIAVCDALATVIASAVLDGSELSAIRLDELLLATLGRGQAEAEKRSPVRSSDFVATQVEMAHKFLVAESTETDTRSRLLDAAAKVLSELGYPEATLSVITKEAHVQKTAIYHYYSSREALIATVLRVGAESMVRCVRSRLDQVPDGTSASRRIAVAVDAHVRCQLARSSYALAIMRTINQVPEDVSRPALDSVRAYGELWRVLIEKLVHEGQLRADVDPTLGRMMILGSLNSCSAWWKPGQGSVDGFIESAQSMVLRSLCR